MTISGPLCHSQIWKRGIELDIPSEELTRRSHQRIANVVADAGKSAGPYQFSFADLLAIAAGILIIRMIFGQAHFRPGFQSGTSHSCPALHVILVGAVVIEEVEFDQLDALVLQIEQRSVQAPAIRPKVSGVRHDFRR